jgi:beta-phosphoglucomutase
VRRGTRRDIEDRPPCLRGVILDLDGLLIDSETWSWHAHNAALTANGERPLALPEVRQLVGLSGNDEWQRLLTLRPLKVEPAAYAGAQEAAFEALRARQMRPLPGVDDLLAAVSHNDLLLALASNSGSASIQETLALLGMADRFDAVISCQDVPRSKPAPDVYCLALARLGLRANQGVAVEDSCVGLAAAAAAGLRCLAVPNGITATQDFSQAHRIFTDLHGVAAWLTMEAGQSLA